MATCTPYAATANTNNGTSYPLNAFTPAVGETLFVFVGTSTSIEPTAAGALTDDQGGTYHLAAFALRGGSSASLYIFVREQSVASAVAHTPTFTCAGDAAQGIVALPWGINITKVGSAAVRQTGKQDNQGSGGTPAPAFPAAALTTNPTLGFVTNTTNPAGLTPPTNWTEPAGFDTGYATPNGGGESCHRDSGFTGTVITWGSTSASAFGSLIVEADASSGHTVTVNQVIETDTAQAITRVKSKAVGQVTETDTSQPVARVKSKAIGQVAETDVSQSIAWAPKHRLVSQVSETDTAQTVTRQKIVLVAQATETDLAQLITKRKVVTVNQATESDLSQAITTQKAKLLGQIAEIDFAQVVTEAGAIVVPVNQVLETDIAQAVTITKIKLLGQVLETDLAQVVGKLKTRLVSQVIEVDTSQSLLSVKRVAVIQVTETDTAQAITVSGSILVGQVLETDLSQSIRVVKVYPILQVTETDIAQLISQQKRVSVLQASEIDFAQQIIADFPFTIVHQVIEIDTAGSLVIQGITIKAGRIVLEEIVTYRIIMQEIIHRTATQETSHRTRSTEER